MSRDAAPGTGASRGGVPLAGLRVVVTRAAAQAEGLAEAYRRAGAEVALLPLLEVTPPSDPTPLAAAAARLAEHAWVAFTSANAVDAFAEHVDAWPDGIRLAAVGDATARALAARGLAADLVPARSDAEGLAAELAPRLAPEEPVLVPQAADARPTLIAALTAAGARVTAVVAYDKRLPADAERRARELFADSPLGWVTFTSPRIARSFAALFGDAWPERRTTLLPVSIGPVTSAELHRLGTPPAAEAAQPSDAALVTATVAALSTR